MYQEVTAENMRKLLIKDKYTLEWILENINKEAKQGYCKLYIYDYAIKHEYKVELIRRGFKVDVGGRYNDKDTLISWDT